MNSNDAPSIHRHLDEAFAAVAMTPELQDLKEELRTNLTDRVAELRADGAEESTAVRTALHELGDIQALIEQVAGDDDSAGRDWQTVTRLHRVRPRPAYVARIVVLAVMMAAAAVVVARRVAGVLDWPTAATVIIAVLALAVPGGLVTADALRQETTVHHPMPTRRAGCYGGSAAAGLAGLALGALGAAGLLRSSPGHGASFVLLVVGVALLLVGVVGLAALGVTQTNRTKAWAMEMARTQQPMDRFSRDPMAAARFGIYTMVIMIIAIASFVVLSMTVGFWWSWLAPVVGVIIFFLILARMLFVSDDRENPAKGGGA